MYSETKKACIYPKPLFQTQNSEIPVKYEKGFDMKTGKLILDMVQPYQKREDKKFYIPVKFYKTPETLEEKVIQETKIVHDSKNFY